MELHYVIDNEQRSRSPGVCRDYGQQCCQHRYKRPSRGILKTYKRQPVSLALIQKDADAVYRLASLCCNLQTKTLSNDGFLQTYYYLHLRMADYKLCSARPHTRV